MQAIFKIWENGKMKTFKEEAELKAFALEKNFIDYIALRIIGDDEHQSTWQVQVKDNAVWITDVYIHCHDNGLWSWTENFHNGSRHYETVNKCLKDFIRAKRNVEQENARYTIWDVYTPRELGL